MSTLTLLDSSLTKALSVSKKQTWGPLWGAGRSCLISRLAQQFQKPICIITAEQSLAQQISQELMSFLPESRQQDMLHFPDRETLPYDQFSPHQALISQRLEVLYRLPALQQSIVIVAIPTLMQRLPPCDYVTQHAFLLQQSDHCDLSMMRERLNKAGYRCVNQVVEHGEFAIRGAILDLFPMGSATPYRIDLFDNEVDSIRVFDPETQRSTDIIQQIALLPAHEFPLTPEAITRFRQQWRDKFAGNPMQSPLYQDVSQGLAPAGIEYYLPLFFENNATLFDYLPTDTLLVWAGDVYTAAQQFWEEVDSRYEQRRYDISRPLLTPAEITLPVEGCFEKINAFTRIVLTEATDKLDQQFDCTALPSLVVESRNAAPFHALNTFIHAHSHRLLFSAESPGRREALIELLKPLTIYPKVFESWDTFLSSDTRFGIIVAPFDSGFMTQQPAIALIPETALFGMHVAQQRRRKGRVADTDSIIRSLAELHIGAPVVHIDHGVGRYQGLTTLTVGDYTDEFVILQYAGTDRVYVPVSSLHLLSRYNGIDPELAPLHRLGSDQWEKAKRKAAEKVRDVAAELLDLYAQRAAKPGHAYRLDENAYQQFVADFPFEETVDQAQVIAEVIQDMQSPKTMDRLICGDVGFGKTEVAMRAAFIAVQGDKQVALLVPTTLLAQQHYQTFQDRFANYAVRIALLSRFRSQKEMNQHIAEITEGKIDIVIGTHKLLQDNLKFKNLGLVIIDEEHRFGVRQKERLKSLRAEVDILTLTATPIPRTLNMAFSGIRDLSIIATPPARRLSIKTFVQPRHHLLIREAILRELLRGGQVYFVHNKVETIERIAQDVRELVPEARVGVGHGQMRERELERVMSDFYHHRFNVLLCTTIIETGIDIPNANTIIIDRADCFGLAQLHQLRGRVGRSHHQAYAYLMTPPPDAITTDAKKRLEAIASLEDLGAGFTLATHDLEIRGVGELLGEDQSGNIQSIGFTLYNDLLDRAVKALKSGKQWSLDQSMTAVTEIQLQITALIPEDYVGDVHTRLILYKRISNASSQPALDELQVEMIDRFGLLPETTKRLFKITELKLQAEKLGIHKIDGHAQGGRIEFHPEPPIEAGKLIKLIQTQSHIYKLDGSNRIKYLIPTETPETRIKALEKVLETLKKQCFKANGALTPSAP